MPSEDLSLFQSGLPASYLTCYCMAVLSRNRYQAALCLRVLDVNSGPLLESLPEREILLEKRTVHISTLPLHLSN